MKKKDFLRSLRLRLYGMPKEDVERSVSYYSEMIDDRIEDGYSESAAVRAVGSVEDAVAQIRLGMPEQTVAYTPKKEKQVSGMKTWQIVLLCATAIVWVPVLIALVFGVALPIVIVAFVLVIVAFAVFVAVFATGVGLSISSVVYFLEGNAIGAVTVIGGGMVMIGLGLILFAFAIWFARFVPHVIGKAARLFRRA